MVKTHTIDIHKGYLKLSFIQNEWLEYFDECGDTDAVFCHEGDIVFCKALLNNKIIFHRPIGPALILTNGHQEWALNGKQKRKDGPSLKTSSNLFTYKATNKVFYTPEEEFWNY